MAGGSAKPRTCPLLAWFIESVFRASAEKGRELWGRVDNEVLKRYYREEYGDPKATFET